MALYSDFITVLRRELRDLDQLGDDKFDGDGSTLLFPLSHRPIKTGSYIVKVGGVTKTETTEYTLDKDLGLVTFVSEPAIGSDNVEVIYRYQKLTDTEYIDAINDAIDRWRWKFWKDTLNTTITTDRTKDEYDLSSITGILYVINAWYLPTASAGTSIDYQNIGGFTNWQYYVAQQKLAIKPRIDVTGLTMKLRVLTSLTKGTTTSSTLDILPEWYLPFKLYVKGVFFDRLIPEKIFETGAVTTIPTFTPAQLAYQMSQQYIQDADKIVNRIAPRMPNMAIRNNSEGIIL